MAKKVRHYAKNRPTMEKKEDGKIHIVQLGSYSRPEIKEYYNDDFVAYGEDNDYFNYLIDRYNGSPTNNAAINGISEMIYGRGLDATDSKENEADYKEMKELLKKNVVKRVCHDFKMMGQAAMQVIYTKDRSKIAQVEHIPVETLRAEKCNSKGEIEAYYYHSNWSEAKPNDRLKRIPAFGFSTLLLRYFTLSHIAQDSSITVLLIIKVDYSMQNLKKKLQTITSIIFRMD